MKEALGELEKFLHFEGTMPALIHCGLAHAPFKPIHPFLDGNGRVGRLLIDGHHSHPRNPVTILFLFAGASQRFDFPSKQKVGF
jgi:hypothetical protein